VEARQLLQVGLRHVGATDPLAGFAETTANLIVAFYFAKRGFENVARILKR